MIKLTRMDRREIIINSDIIESVEQVPHTVIKTVHGNKYVVCESAEDIVSKVIEYKQKIAFKNCSEEM